MNEEDLLSITPKEFEEYVKRWLEMSAQSISTFKIHHLKNIEGSGGKYEIDIIVEVEVFGGSTIKILVECKRYKYPIKRDIVMILESKLRDIGAHKGIIFSTSDFQSGAIEYAVAHGIALIKIAGDETKQLAKSYGAEKHNRKGYIGWFLKNGGSEELVDETYTEPLKKWLQNLPG